MHNARAGGGIASVALPGLGANTGKVPVEICADLMWTGYSLFRRREFESFTEMRAALEEELGPLGAPGPKPKGKVAVPGAAPGTPKPAPAADPDADFDDADDDE